MNRPRRGGGEGGDDTISICAKKLKNQNPIGYPPSVPYLPYGITPTRRTTMDALDELRKQRQMLLRYMDALAYDLKVVEEKIRVFTAVRGN